MNRSYTRGSGTPGADAAFHDAHLFDDALSSEEGRGRSMAFRIFICLENVMVKILVSACLVGCTTRWHGRKVPYSSYVRKFLKENPDVQLIPVCPEQLGGLPTPRPPVKSRGGRIYETCEDKTLRDEVTGADVTDNFVSGAQATLAIAKKKHCKRAILLKTSPSCSRTGITGKLLLTNGIEVINVL